MKLNDYLFLTLISVFIQLNGIAQVENNSACLSGDCQNGFGKAVYYLEDTLRYEGQFVDQMWEGNGTLEVVNKYIYTGEFKENNCFGKGKIKFINGDQYDGMVVNSIIEGDGIFYYKSGEKLSGVFKNGSIWNGTGYIQLSEKAYYIGDFKEGKYHGQGFIMYENGSSYKGSFSYHKMTGSGKITWGDGSYYIGDVLDGKMHGTGKMYNASGNLDFEGEWQNDEPQPKQLTAYEKYSPIFNECFKGYIKINALNQEAYVRVNLCFSYYSMITATGTFTIEIDGVDYVSKAKFSGNVDESDNTFTLNFVESISKDALPLGLVWQEESMSGTIYSNPEHDGYYTLQGETSGGSPFEVSDY